MYIQLMLGRATYANLFRAIIWSCYCHLEHVHKSGKAVKAVPVKIKHRNVVILFSQFWKDMILAVDYSYSAQEQTKDKRNRIRQRQKGKTSASGTS